MKKFIRILLLLIITLSIFYFLNRASYYTSCYPIEQLPELMSQDIYFISKEPKDLLIGIAVSVITTFILSNKAKNKKKFMDGKEYGTAAWGTAKDIKPYMEKDDSKNIILSQTERVRLNGRPKDPRKALNANVLIIGGSGSGKTRFYIKPNILQAHCSYVITDPKGTLLNECGIFLRRKGYKIKILNLKDPYSMEHVSMRYNPFAYIRSEADILTLVDTFMANTNGDKKGGGDPFWPNAEKLLYMALIGYIWFVGLPEEKNFTTLIHMVRECEIRENDESFKNAIDILFEQLEQNGSKIYYRDKNGKEISRHISGDQHFAVKQYKGFRNLAAGKTAKSILISCMARLAPFDIPQVSNLTLVDEMDFPKIGEEKTAVFVILSDTNKAFNFIASIFYTQLFNELVVLADTTYKGRLPIHVRCLLDEFANIGKIPDFETLIATIRSREISANVVLQTTAQLKTIYKDNADTITGNCDSMIFLGGKEKGTLEEISKMLGKQTIDTRTTGESSGGQSKSHNQNYQRTGRDLMSPDEIARMDGGKCIVQLRGAPPFLSKKYDLLKHPNYHCLADADPKFYFDPVRYMEARKPKPIDIEEVMEEIVILNGREDID